MNPNPPPENPPKKPPETPPRAPDHFEGLSSKAKLGVVLAAIVLAVVCIWWGLWEAHVVADGLGFQEPDIANIEKLYDKGHADKISDQYFLAHLVNVQAHLKGISNRHAMGALAIASGLALFAIGFALFILGVDGAFSVQARRGPSTALAVSGTAPGLLCFVAATILVGVGATRPHGLEIGDFKPPILDYGPQNGTGGGHSAIREPVATDDGRTIPEDTKKFFDGISGAGEVKAQKDDGGIPEAQKDGTSDG